MITTHKLSKSEDIIKSCLPLNKKTKLKLVPFRFFNAITDLKENIIYISSNLEEGKIQEVIADEYSHILSNSSIHDNKWKLTCKEIYGLDINPSLQFDENKKRLGIPKHFAANVGNVTGIQNLLLDFHLLQSYRKFSQRILATEGQWEVKGDNLIKLLPIPRGSYPVFVEYYPSVNRWRTPVARELMRRLIIAESSIILGNIRTKRALPLPDGGTTTFGGEALILKGYEEREKVYKEALLLGEPPGIYAL